jgi:hypothetical protein
MNRHASKSDWYSSNACKRSPRASGMRAVVAAPNGDLPHVPLNAGPPRHSLLRNT